MTKSKCSPVKTMEIYKDDLKYLLQLFGHIFNVIEETRKRKKRPSREVVLKAVCERHGLVDSVVSEVLYLLIDSNSVYTKNDNKGNDSLFINTELRGELLDAFGQISDENGSETISRETIQPNTNLESPFIAELNSMSYQKG